MQTLYCSLQWAQFVDKRFMAMHCLVPHSGTFFTDVTLGITVQKAISRSETYCNNYEIIHTNINTIKLWATVFFVLLKLFRDLFLVYSSISNLLVVNFRKLCVIAPTFLTALKTLNCDICIVHYSKANLYSFQEMRKYSRCTYVCTVTQNCLRFFVVLYRLLNTFSCYSIFHDGINKILMYK